VAIPLDPSRFFVTDKDLDFAICAVADGRQVAQRKAIPLRRNNYKPDDECIVIQHPRGEPKTLATGQIIMEDSDFFYHSCNTLPGSSGRFSPIRLILSSGR
jgi:hypothetical protein